MAPLISLSPEDLEKIRDLIYRETGMLFENKKDYILKNRLEQRMTATRTATFSEYYHGLVYSEKKAEMMDLVESLTVNETYFFRDFPQLQGFAEQVLPRHLEKKRAAQDYTLRVWSAACSTGEEPYTLSIILQEMIEDRDQWEIVVDAVDIDRQVLRAAERGEYGERSMKDTPYPYRLKYFRRTEDSWQVLPQASRPVRFAQMNLMDRQAMRQRRGYDFVFCRNVLIYFDDVSRKTVVNGLYDALRPGGYLFLGSSESVGRITAAFQLEKVNDFLCYKRP